jgi:hypothetical protein
MTQMPRPKFEGLNAQGRDLPENISIPGYDSYQVRIARNGHEYSSTFHWARFGGKERALQSAVKWRDQMISQLPAAENGRGSFRTSPMAHKYTFGRVGITKYPKKDRRRTGQPAYLVYGVNWVDEDGAPRVKQFQVGRIGNFDWDQELHTALTAEAFRTEWEFCVSAGISFDPERYQNWKEVELYPFWPPNI